MSQSGMPVKRSPHAMPPGPIYSETFFPDGPGPVRVSLPDGGVAPKYCECGERYLPFMGSVTCVHCGLEPNPNSLKVVARAEAPVNPAGEQALQNYGRGIDEWTDASARKLGG